MQHFNCTDIAFEYWLTNATRSPAGGRNPFVQAALVYTLSYLNTPLDTGLTITILADNDYYSNPSTNEAPTTMEAIASAFTPSSRFANFGVRLSEAHKTGLGSSAALTTAFCTALVSYLNPLADNAADEAIEKKRRELHNLSQTAHCSAQGKVGSGFDVAAAVYGSCLYRRFSPSLLSELGSAEAYQTPQFRSKLRELVNETGKMKWDQECRKEGVQVPKGYELVMADVDCGSESVGMAKKVLSWRASSSSDANRIWDALQTANEGLGAVLSSGDEAKIRQAIDAVRALIREMGTKSCVPIEPSSQTALLDALESLEGVVGGVVPGAGGYDAVALLVRDNKETKARLEKFLEEWSAKVDGRVRLLRVKGEMEGVRSEDVKDYGEWIKL